jgi:hypothetical protein
MTLPFLTTKKRAKKYGSKNCAPKIVAKKGDTGVFLDTSYLELATKGSVEKQTE